MKPALAIGGCLLLTLPVVAATPAKQAPIERVREVARPWVVVPDDPQADGFGTELDYRAADDQLHHIAELLAAETAIDEAHLRPLIVEEPAFTPLRPPLATAFADDPLLVLRPASPQAGAPARGGAALAAALEALREPFAGPADAWFHFKSFEVDATGGEGTFRTRSYYEAFGRGPRGGGVQQTAIWHCDWVRVPDAAPRLAAIEVQEFEEVRLTRGARTLFEDYTRSVLAGDANFDRQLRYGTEHWMRRLQAVLGIDNFGHNGLAVGDVNGDGLPDLYACQTGGLPNRLYVQRPDGTAREVSAEAGVDFMERTHAALLLDLDNDGDQDLALAGESSVLVLANDGAGRFEPVAELPQENAYSLTAADYDLDGDLDLYACNYVPAKTFNREGGLGLQPMPYHDAANGAPNALLRNEGGLRFVDATAATGLDANNTRWSFAAAWEDYDNDGDPDLYVANDYGRNNLYRNDGGRFTDVAAAAGVEDMASGMSVAWGDADGDGWMDLYVGNMYSSAGRRITTQPAFRAAEGGALRDTFRRFARGNSLFRNLGNGTFEDVSETAGVVHGRWAWGTQFADLNNDGRLDLVVGNGFITNEDTKDL